MSPIPSWGLMPRPDRLLHDLWCAPFSVNAQTLALKFNLQGAHSVLWEKQPIARWPHTCCHCRLVISQYHPHAHASCFHSCVMFRTAWDPHTHALYPSLTHVMSRSMYVIPVLLAEPGYNCLFWPPARNLHPRPRKYNPCTPHTHLNLTVCLDMLSNRLEINTHSLGFP